MATSMLSLESLFITEPEKVFERKAPLLPLCVSLYCVLLFEFENSLCCNIITSENMASSAVICKDFDMDLRVDKKF